MICPDAISSLNRLHYLMLRSFAAYSVEVRPVTYRGPQEMHNLLKQIAGEQQALAERIAESVRGQNAAPEPGQFPIDFTSWNDVALPRILERTVELLQQVLLEATALAAHDPPPLVFHFAKEVLSLTERHVRMLADILGTKAEVA